MTLLDGAQNEADERKKHRRTAVRQVADVVGKRSLRHKSRGAVAQTAMISSGSAAVAFFKPITSSRLGLAVQAAIRMTQC
eukprot:6095496-Amphidinium_carterae.2